MKLVNAGDAAIRVVLANDVQLLTVQGWELLFVYQETYAASCLKQEPVTQSGYTSYNNVTEFHPATLTYFVLRKSAQSAVADAEARAASAGTALDAVRQDAKRFLDELEKSKKNVERMTGELESAKQFSVRQGDDIKRLRTSGEKLEADLAKVRVAIGAKAFSEILPKEEKP